VPLGRRARAFHSRKHHRGALPMLAEETDKLFGNFATARLDKTRDFTPNFLTV
jgi:hypothetical protein